MFKKISLLFLLLLSVEGAQALKVTASESPEVGLIGETRFSRSCSQSQRMTGLQLSTSDDHILVQCTPYANNGRWSSRDHLYTAPINPQPTPRLPGKISFISNLSCPEHTWVGGIEGRTPFLNTGGRRLINIGLNCFRGDENGNVSGDPTQIFWNSKTGFVSSGRCPNNKIAFGVSGSRNGEKISSLRLKCKSVFALPLAAPTLLRLGSPATQEVKPGVHQFYFRPVQGATHYRIRILSDSPSPRNWFDQYFGGRLLFANGGNERYVKISIPNSTAGTVAKWKASACNRQKQCGPWSEWMRFSIVP